MREPRRACFISESGKLRREGRRGKGILWRSGRRPAGHADVEEPEVVELLLEEPGGMKLRIRPSLSSDI